LKAIILAAWEWVRLKPITDDIPKALVEIQGKSLLEYNLENIYKYVNEIIIVIGYKKEKVIEKFWEYYRWVKIRYHEQDMTKKWTAWAMMGISIEEDFILLFADMVIDKSDLQNVLTEKNDVILTMKVKNPEKYGICFQDKDNNLIEIIEKPKEFIGNLANTGCIKVKKELLHYLKNISLSPRGEYELTDAINLYARDYKLKVFTLKKDFIDITSPEDVERLNKKKDIKIIALTEHNFDEEFQDFLELIEKPNILPKNVEKEVLKEIFSEFNKNGVIYLAKKGKETVGLLQMEKEKLFISWWILALKIEKISVKIGYEWLGIGSLFLKKALLYAEEIDAKKIILITKEFITPFYEKFWFKKIGVNMEKEM